MPSVLPEWSIFFDGDWECTSCFLVLSFRGRGSSNLLNIELVYLLGSIQLFLVNLIGRLFLCGRYSLFLLAVFVLLGGL